MNKRKIAGIVLIAAALLLACAALWLWRTPIPVEEPEESISIAPTPEPSEDPVPSEEDLPYDKLFITVERQNYADGDLRLVIPKLDRDLVVYNGTDKATLKKGVGLYDYAQLPGQGNRNVSIAGHRNTIIKGKISDQAPFYYIDTLEEGDYLYLVDAQHIYRYLWDSCTIVEADDWGPIYSQGFSCVTLTSCHPIGISDHRIIVVGRLDEIFDFDAEFIYYDNAKEANDHEIELTQSPEPT